MITIPQAITRMGVCRTHFFALRRIDPSFPEPKLAEVDGRWRICFDPIEIDTYNAQRWVKP